MIDAVTFDFEHGGEGFGEEDLFAEGGYDGILEGMAWDAGCAAACFAFGA